MAAMQQADMSSSNMDEKEANAVEMDGCSANDHDGQPERKELPADDQETEDPFKKPAIFAAPSLASKRSLNPAAPSKTQAETKTEKEHNEAQVDDTICELSADDNKTQEDNKNADKHKDSSPVKVKTEPKQRVLSTKAPAIPYTEPQWGGPAPDDAYALEILKNGTIVDRVPLTHKSYFVVGRLPVCDVSLEHPSISRYHAVIQFRQQPGETESIGEEPGFYIHDLGSTHGTVVNKNKIPPKTYIRLRVGHVLKFGGSTRLFILQGPEFDEEEESELTVTELREQARKQRAELEKRMMGEGSDEDELEEKDKGESAKRKLSGEDSGCPWGMAEEPVPEDDENEENPFSTEFHEDQEAAYLKDPKKALQGFYDREGEELEIEYEDKNHGTWLCRIKLPVDDAMGRQLVAEVTHTGKKKEAAVQCCLECCRMLEARGLLRQEAVSRKRKKKNWEDEDYYDSDDDTFLDRTGTVEKKRKQRMKKAGKIEERPETYESLIAKLSEVEKEVAETQKKLGTCGKNASGSSTDDPLDAFMTAVRSEAAMDAVERRKLHMHVADLRKDAQRLRKLVELTRPAQLPSLLPSSSSSESEKPKKALPLFGAMKGGKKFKLKTGTIGRLPPKQPSLPPELFTMKELPPGGEEDEEEEEEEEGEKSEKKENQEDTMSQFIVDSEESGSVISQETSGQKEESPKKLTGKACTDADNQFPSQNTKPSTDPPAPESRSKGDEEPSQKKKKKVMGPSKPPVLLSGQYPQDDPDYCVWMPPAGQTGDGRTHLNDKYGY